jgi:hypothetical protein
VERPVFRHGGIPGGGGVRFIRSKVRVRYGMFIAGVRFSDRGLDFGSAMIGMMHKRWPKKTWFMQHLNSYESILAPKYCFSLRFKAAELPNEVRCGDPS